MIFTAGTFNIFGNFTNRDRSPTQYGKAEAAGAAASPQGNNAAPTETSTTTTLIQCGT